MTSAPAEDASALLTAIVTSSDDAIIGSDLNDVVTSWNPGAERLFGHAASDMIGRAISDLIPADRVAEYRAIRERVLRRDRVAQIETVWLAKDGQALSVALKISPILDAGGSVVGLSSIVRDRSEQQSMIQELRVREALLRSMVDIVPDGLVVIDRKGTVQSFNAAAEQVFGYTAAEVVGRNVSVLMPAKDAAAHDGYIDHYLRTGERRIIGIGRIVLARRKDGSTFPLELRIAEVHVAGTHLFVGSVRDLTAREQHERRMAELQAEVIHMSRLSELGHMVSAIAHEVNQPLAAIGNYTAGMRRLLTDAMPPQLHQATERIGAQAERARGIIASLRALVKKGDRPRQDENLEILIREASALALVGTNRTVALDLRVAPDALIGYLDKVQIQQVLLNLIRNAVEAMAGTPGSRLAITTARVGERVEVTVADNGPGLPEHMRGNVFKPFTTTKADGLGVGLSICRTIVEAHGGMLTAESPAAGGAVFRFSVPGSADESSASL
jgi:two-component system, LuxR family, sensor kinase FixL